MNQPEKQIAIGQAADIVGILRSAIDDILGELEQHNADAAACFRGKVAEIEWIEVLNGLTFGDLSALAENPTGEIRNRFSRDQLRRPD